MNMEEALRIVGNIPYIPWIELNEDEKNAIKIIYKYMEESIESQEQIDALKLENAELKKQLADKTDDWKRTLINLDKMRCEYERQENNRRNGYRDTFTPNDY